MPAADNAFVLRSDQQKASFGHPDFPEPLLTFAPKTWETGFFKRPFATLEINQSFLTSFDTATLKPLLRKLLRHADEQKTTLIELSLDSRGFGVIPTLEASGFRLVDSKVCFFTLINRRKTERFNPEVGSLAMATPADLPAIIELTKTSFCQNPAFFSRFKHRGYFSEKESENYYCAWITKHFDDPLSLMAVLRDKDAVQGYFFYRKDGMREDLPVYKGMLAAVAPPYRQYKSHLALQTFLFDQLPHNRFFVDNTTQLTNFPILKNHITAQRQLKSVTFVLYRKQFGQD